MYRLATLTTLALAFFITAVPSIAQQARFEGLGGLEEGLWSLAYGVSADGSTVVGKAAIDTGNNAPAFRWQNGEMEALPFIPRLTDGDAALVEQDLGQAVSADGAVVVGGTFAVVARWESGEVRVLNDPERCAHHTWAQDVSADGSIVVSDCSNGQDGREAVRWVDGEMEGLGWLPDADDQWSYATAISSDGSTILGSSRSGVLPWPAQSAFRWTEEGGMEDICPEQAWCNYPEAISEDGSVIVGYNGYGALRPDLSIAWRWEEGVGVEQLALPEGWMGAHAVDVSADGSIIVGIGWSETGSHSFIWTEEDGVRDLWEVFENDFGLDMTGWDHWAHLTSISDDGTVIVGNAINPEGQHEAWRAEAPFGGPIADEATPEALADVLSAPSPNPVRGTSTFTVAVERGQHVAVEVFDALGRQVQTVYEGALATGMSEQLTLDASALPAGVYLIRATGEDFAKTQRVTVVR